MADREIVVDRDWFTRLVEYLHPEERWLSSKAGGLVLFACDFSSGDTYRLIFKPKPPHAPAQT